VVDDISHEGRRRLLREEAVSFQLIKTWKQSSDPDSEAKKHRILHRYGLIDGTVDAQPGDPRWSSASMSSGCSTSNRTRAGSGPLPAVANASWRNRIEAQFTALGYFAVDGTDHSSHIEQASMIRRSIAWRNRNTRDRHLGKIVNRANIA
jgi:hypothetical protein